MKAPFFLISIAIISGSCARNNPQDLEKLRPAATQAAPFDPSNPNTVTVYSNGYVYPREQSNGYGSISTSGLGAWTDTAGFTRVFFYPQQTGQISPSRLLYDQRLQRRLLWHTGKFHYGKKSALLYLEQL